MTSLKGKPALYGAIGLAFNKETRKGIWWYDPKKRGLVLSKTAHTHFNSEEFLPIKNKREWIRGMVFVKNRKLHILVYQADPIFPRVNREILIKLFWEIQLHYNKKISGIVNEQGMEILTLK